MTKQTEAQRLAGALGATYSNEEHLVHAAAAELRRLSDVELHLNQVEKGFDKALARITALEQANKELLAFAREYLVSWGDLPGYLQDMARAAIAKHGEK